MTGGESVRMRMLIADHAATRLGIRIALSDEVEVCAEAGDAEHAIQEAGRSQPDVCLVSLEIPGGGLDAIRGICEAAPDCAVIVLAERPVVDDLLAAIRAGAVGYLPGGVSADPLRRVIRAVAAREAAVPRTMVLDLMAELRTLSGGHGLTSREGEVLGLLRRGHSTAAIAGRLQIAPVTVRRHISRLVEKAGVADRSELVAAERAASTGTR